MTTTVYIVVTPTDRGTPEIEVLDECPQWDWEDLGQDVYVANVNGGDSVLIRPGYMPEV